MDPKEIEARFNAIRKGGECLEAVGDPASMQALLLDTLFDLIPAKRGAILLNGPRVSPDPGDFMSVIYRQRGGGVGEEFEVSGKALEFVYAHRQPCMSNDVMPAIMCAPLILPNSAIIGVIYLDTSELGTFEMDDLGVLKKLSGSAANLINDSLEYQRRIH